MLDGFGLGVKRDEKGLSKSGGYNFGVKPHAMRGRAE